MQVPQPLKFAENADDAKIEVQPLLYRSQKQDHFEKGFNLENIPLLGGWIGESGATSS